VVRTPVSRRTVGKGRMEAGVMLNQNTGEHTTADVELMGREGVWTRGRMRKVREQYPLQRVTAVVTDTPDGYLVSKQSGAKTVQGILQEQREALDAQVAREDAAELRGSRMLEDALPLEAPVLAAVGPDEQMDAGTGEDVLSMDELNPNPTPNPQTNHPRVKRGKYTPRATDEVEESDVYWTEEELLPEEMPLAAYFTACKGDWIAWEVLHAFCMVLCLLHSQYV
jgi:hypothetical protein